MRVATIYFIGSAIAGALLWALRDVPVLSHPAVIFYFQVVPPVGFLFGIIHTGILVAMHMRFADVLSRAMPLVIFSVLLIAVGRVLLG